MGDSAAMAVMITRDGMGSAVAELRHKLMKTWLQVVEANGRPPGALCFYADGVKLVAEGSPVLAELRRLEAAGCRLIICQTCLYHFGLAERVAVGVVGGMGDIVAAQLSAKQVVTI